MTFVVVPFEIRKTYDSLLKKKKPIISFPFIKCRLSLSLMVSFFCGSFFLLICCNNDEGRSTAAKSAFFYVV